MHRGGDVSVAYQLETVRRLSAKYKHRAHIWRKRKLVFKHNEQAATEYVSISQTIKEINL